MTQSHLQVMQIMTFRLQRKSAPNFVHAYRK